MSAQKVTRILVTVGAQVLELDVATAEKLLKDLAEALNKGPITPSVEDINDYYEQARKRPQFPSAPVVLLYGCPTPRRTWEVENDS